MEAKEMVSTADRDGDRLVSLEELGALMDGGESNALRRAFTEYDEDRDGVVNAEELRRPLHRLRLDGEELTAERCSEMVKAVDCDCNEVISFDEFKAMMATKSA